MQEDRNKLSYSKRLEQDIVTARQLEMFDIVTILESKLEKLKEYKKNYYKTEVKNKKVK